MLYKIGDFSKKTNVRVKTLRYYDEINLFKPLKIDIFTGYRYYSDEQIDDLKLILEIKKANFSLEEIKKLNELKYYLIIYKEYCLEQNDNEKTKEKQKVLVLEKPFRGKMLKVG